MNNANFIRQGWKKFDLQLMSREPIILNVLRVTCLLILDSLYAVTLQWNWQNFNTILVHLYFAALISNFTTS